jgi:hypothetical protein
LAAGAVVGGVVVGTVVDRRADEQRNRAQAERAAERSRCSCGPSAFRATDPSTTTPSRRPPEGARCWTTAWSSQQRPLDIELVDVVVPPQGEVAANQPGRLRNRLIPAQGQADVNLRLRFDCANRPTAAPVLRIVARPPGGREVTTEQRVAELHESISEAAEFRCGGPSDQPPDVAFVSARPRGDRELVLSLHATGAPDIRLSAVAVKYPGLVTKPGTALPIALRGEAPTRVLVTARVADCRAALAATDPPELHASYGSDDDGDGDSDLVSSAGMEPVFVTAIVRFLYATCR